MGSSAIKFVREYSVLKSFTPHFTTRELNGHVSFQVQVNWKLILYFSFISCFLEFQIVFGHFSLLKKK